MGRDTADAPAPQLDTLDGVLTSSAACRAERDTVFLGGSPDQGHRALSLAPDLHL